MVDGAPPKLAGTLFDRLPSFESDEGYEPMGFVRAASAPVYEVGKVVGEGANAIVYQCQDVVSGDVYAYKFPRSPRRTQLRPDEVAAAARISLLRHVNVVKECPSPRGGTIMEFIEGATLRDVLLKQNKPFDDRTASGFMYQILQGLNYLHSKDVVHGDIKCSNVLLESSTGTCKLSDIGRVADEETRHLNGVVLPAGTPAFMAPEVVRTGKHSTASDIWSIGCTLLEMVTAEFPWSAEDSRFSAMFKVAQGQHPPISFAVSEKARSFIEQTFQVEPAARPAASGLLRHDFTLISQASHARRRAAADAVTSGRNQQNGASPMMMSSIGKSQSMKLLEKPVLVFDDSDEDHWSSRVIVRRCASDPTTKLVRRSSPIASPRNRRPAKSVSPMASRRGGASRLSSPIAPSSPVATTFGKLSSPLALPRAPVMTI